MTQSLGTKSLACRFTCTALIAAPFLYRSFVTDGDAYQFLALVLLAPIAGFVLFANSVFCLFRYRSWRAASLSLVFLLVSPAGFLAVWHFLPEFRM